MEILVSAGFKSVEDMEDTFKKIDIDGDGRITKDEMTQFGSLNEQEVNAVFDLGDVDRDGAIDLAEFVGVMSSCAPVPYTESGRTEVIGDREVYIVGSGAKGSHQNRKNER